MDLSGPRRSQAGPPRSRFRPVDDDFLELEAERSKTWDPQGSAKSRAKKKEARKKRAR